MLWPAHPHPYRDELLSSWLVRVAHANGLKVQSFCRLTFGNERQVWNRDIDRLAPLWLIEAMATRTGTTIERVWQTTLMAYRGKLFEQEKASGQLKWMLSLQMYHRKRLGHGMQFCPICLSEDVEPYFRRAWRVALYTFCPKHNCMLLDRCPQCGQGVAYHRIELGHPREMSMEPLCICWACSFDYRQSKIEPVHKWNGRTFQSWEKVLRIIDSGTPSSSRFDYDMLAVLHQMAKLLSSNGAKQKLAEYVTTRTGLAHPRMVTGKLSIESRELIDRHYIMGLAWWLIGRWPSRLWVAWTQRALKYNWLMRDFSHAPSWYRNAADKLHQQLSLKKIGTRTQNERDLDPL